MPGDDRLKLHQTQPLPEYMARLASANASGSLTVSTAEARREIIFVNGEVRAARSSLESEMLGTWLVERQHISEDDKTLTLSAQGGSDSPPLGHILVTRGSLDQPTLESELQALAMAIISRAAEAPHAYCEFLKDEDRQQPDTLPNLTTRQVLLVTARQFSNLESKRATLGSLDQAAWPAEGFDSTITELDLTPSEAFMLSRLDGTRKLSRLVTLSAMAEDEAISTLYTLKMARVITVGPAPLPVPVSREPRDVPVEPIPIDENGLRGNQVAERQEIQRLAERVSRVDHYRALGLLHGAVPRAVDEAWNSMQTRFNPNRALEPHLTDLRRQLETITTRAQEAYEVLSNPVSRGRYDPILKTVQQEAASLRDGAKKRKTDRGARAELVEANLKRADELAEDGEVYLAIQLLEHACTLDPRPAELLKLARLLRRNPLWTNRSLGCLKKAIEVDPGFIDAWIELAEFWRRRNNAERQRKALERALSADPEHSRANQMYGQLVGQKELQRLLRRARQQKK